MDYSLWHSDRMDGLTLGRNNVPVYPRTLFHDLRESERGKGQNFVLLRRDRRANAWCMAVRKGRSAMHAMAEGFFT